MIKGILHAHSDHSFDAFDSIRFIAEWAKSESLDFVVLTEHDNDFSDDKYGKYVQECQSVSKELGLVILPAMEYSFGEKGRTHINVLGVDKFLQKEKFSNDIGTFVDEVKRLGGIVLLNHPLNIIKKFDTSIINKFDGYEIWNTKYDHYYAPNLNNVSWFRKLKRKENNGLLAIAASDIHAYPPKRYVSFIFDIPNENISCEEIVAAVRTGNFYAEFQKWTILPCGKLKTNWYRYVLMVVSSFHENSYLALRKISRAMNYKPPSWIVKFLKFKK